MRLGGPIFVNDDPEQWAGEAKRLGYRAAVCPIGNDASADVVANFASVAEKNDILIAEVGAWSNSISPDDNVRRDAVEYCKRQLALADAINARCCVNIAGSRGDVWDGPHPDNVSDDTFALIVDTVRDIIDSVKPTRTHYALESMPYTLPDSPDAYLDLLKAIDRKEFAVHLDPVNLISSPRKLYRNRDFIRECFRKLGPYILSCHAKDIAIGPKLTVHLDERIPGQGSLDYSTLLTELHRLHPDTPVLVEHLSTEQEYKEAADYIRSVAANHSIPL